MSAMTEASSRYTAFDALTALEDEFDRVNHLGYELSDRLGSVLRPVEPQPAPEDIAAIPESEHSPLAVRLMDLQRRLEGHEDRLRDLLRRFDA